MMDESYWPSDMRTPPLARRWRWYRIRTRSLRPWTWEQARLFIVGGNLQ